MHAVAMVVTMVSAAFLVLFIAIHGLEAVEARAIPSYKQLKHSFLTRKKTLWDPMSSSMVLIFCVAIYSEVYSYAAGALYQGGFEDLAHSWASQPVIDLKVVGHTEDCPSGWEETPYYNNAFESIKVLPHEEHGRLCLLRAGLVANIVGEPPRPQSECSARENLKTCATGDFPFCGDASVKCPLVDLADFMADGKTANMRHSCTSHIPDAYLSWAGCRPVVDVIVASAPPCFKYDRNAAWHVEGDQSEKGCDQRDTRYRFLKAQPFRSEDGHLVADSPDSGVYVRNEIFYNPSCTLAQDKFNEGSSMVADLLWQIGLAVIVAMATAVWTGAMWPLFGQVEVHESLHLAFRRLPVPWPSIVKLACRVVCFVLQINVLYTILFYTSDYFHEVAHDPTCVDPLVEGFIQSFLEQLFFIKIYVILCCILLILQFIIDCTHLASEAEERAERNRHQLDEAAPLFGSLPKEPEQHRAERQGIKYVFVPRTTLLPADVKS